MRYTQQYHQVAIRGRVSKTVLITVFVLALIIGGAYVIIQEQNEVAATKAAEADTIQKNGHTFLQPNEWRETDKSRDHQQAALFMPEAALKDPRPLKDAERTHPANLDPRNGALLYYKYDTVSYNGSNEARKAFDSADFPRRESMCNEVGFYYGGTETKTRDGETQRSFPNVTDEVVITGNADESARAHDGITETNIQYKGICRTIGKMNTEANQFQYYSVFYFARSGAFQSPIMQLVRTYNPFRTQ